ncbi:MAG: hypothetical protein Q4G67_09040 [Actinomycetia bacterium]|nr:hypothetical protein [Actinomycetes bacterium]
MTRTLTHWSTRLRAHLQGAREERGDIPGWVMVVLMTAALVAAVWVIAEPALRGLFSDAIDDVSRNR